MNRLRHLIYFNYLTYKAFWGTIDIVGYVGFKSSLIPFTNIVYVRPFGALCINVLMFFSLVPCTYLISLAG